MGCGKSKHDVVTGNTASITKSESKKGRGRETNSIDRASSMKKQGSQKSNNLVGDQSEDLNTGNDKKPDCSKNKIDPSSILSKELSSSGYMKKENDRQEDESVIEKLLDEQGTSSVKETLKKKKEVENKNESKKKKGIMSEDVAVVEGEKSLVDTKKVNKKETRKDEIPSVMMVTLTDKASVTNEDEALVSIEDSKTVATMTPVINEVGTPISNDENNTNFVKTETVVEETPTAKEDEILVSKDDNKTESVTMETAAESAPVVKENEILVSNDDNKTDIIEEKPAETTAEESKTV